MGKNMNTQPKLPREDIFDIHNRYPRKRPAWQQGRMPHSVTQTQIGFLVQTKWE